MKELLATKQHISGFAPLKSDAVLTGVSVIDNVLTGIKPRSAGIGKIVWQKKEMIDLLRDGIGFVVGWVKTAEREVTIDVR